MAEVPTSYVTQECFIYMETKQRRNILRMKERNDSALRWHQGHP